MALAKKDHYLLEILLAQIKEAAQAIVRDNALKDQLLGEQQVKITELENTKAKEKK